MEKCTPEFGAVCYGLWPCCLSLFPLVLFHLDLDFLLLTWFILSGRSPPSSVAHACFALSCFVGRRKAEAVKVKCAFGLCAVQTPLWCLCLCLFHCDGGRGVCLCVRRDTSSSSSAGERTQSCRQTASVCLFLRAEGIMGQR